MDRRYQVFVSSTYADLKEERSRVIQTLMELDCIPAGMELFPAMDEEQFEFIKRVIDDCDYYILIIGGRYGSTTSEGISYTEKEYDYAQSRGLKVLAFLHEKPGEISMEKSEVDPDLRTRLENFRSKASTGRLVKFWTSAEQLPGLVALSLSKTIKTYPAIGWVRANHIANVDALGELNELRKLNDELEKLVAELSGSQSEIEGLAGLEEYIDLSIKIYYRSPVRSSATSIKLSFGEIFTLIAPEFLSPQKEYNILSRMQDLLLRTVTQGNGDRLRLERDSFNTVKIQFVALRLIKITDENIWSLTTKGHDTLLQLRTVKTSNR